jgi:hypothetical protein
MAVGTQRLARHREKAIAKRGPESRQFFHPWSSRDEEKSPAVLAGDPTIRDVSRGGPTSLEHVVDNSL